MQFSSAYSNYQDEIDFRVKHGHGHPRATNYKPEFQDTLDYIFYNNLEVSKILEIDDDIYNSEAQ